MLMIPTRKVPMAEWHKYGGHVVDRLTDIAAVYREQGNESEAMNIERNMWKITALRIVTTNHPDKWQLRQNYADVFRRVLRRMKDYSDDMQRYLDCDWWGNFKCDRAARIFGSADLGNPIGLGDGTPILAGYLPYIMKNLILEQTGFLWMGWLKPRMGLTGALPAEGYDRVYDIYMKDKTFFDLSARGGLAKLTA